MWPFSKKQTLQTADIFRGATDWHSHLLPGVDDGVRNMHEALDALTALQNLGFRRVWITPHIMEDYPNTPSDLKHRFNELTQEWNGEMELRLGAEHMIDAGFGRLLETDDLLPIGDTNNLLLVEMSFMSPPFCFENTLDRIRSHGYFPLLAHPERYRFLEPEDLKTLHDSETLFQINFLSLTGAYGQRACEQAQWLLSEGLADLTGSDLHRISQLEQVYAGKLSHKLIDKIGALVSENRYS